MNTNINFSEYQFDGQALTKDNVLANKHIDYTNSYIFFTLNSSKPYTKGQYKATINKVMAYIVKHKKINIAAQWYYEDKDSNGNPTRVHVHGMISNVPESYYPYEGLLTYISKLFHKEIGKPRIPHKVCAYIEWANSNAAVATYCSKQRGIVNYYIPEDYF